MYPLGFLPFFCSLVSHDAAVHAALLVPLVVLALWFYAVALRPQLAAKNADDVRPVQLPGSSLSHILPFFHRRFDFINQGFELAGQAIYQFSLLRNPVIVLSGEAARRDFFQAKDLDLGAGFKFLSGAIPMLPGVTTELGPRVTALIYKRLAASQTSESLSRHSRRTMSAWGYSGTLDPFESVSELLFQISVRALAFTELADDPAIVKRLRELYDALDTATTPATVLLPWIPSPSAVRKILSTKRIYDIISKALDDRVKNGVARDDTPQMLIDAGDERLIIIGRWVFCCSVPADEYHFRPAASWLFTFLSGHPEWREKAAEEMRGLIARHVAPSSPLCTSVSRAESPTDNAPGHHPERASSSSSSAREGSPHNLPPMSSLTASLSNIPLSAWENETPVLDALIRETLRVAEPHVAMRQYLPLSQSHAADKELFLGGRQIPRGAYVMYPFSDVHLSSEIYKDPWRWDPARKEMDLKAPYSYVGMGAGSTMCQGKRLATLELKLITAQVVLGFRELRAVDTRGATLSELPRPNWNDVLTCKPPKGSCYVRYERTGEHDP
uniref:Cyp51A n=1 Tax=Ganoderma boninense TaxID=34458 RepID=A0A5K1JX43_9APHY|nr:Cyp51A [Ganoderma boninense]